MNIGIFTDTYEPEINGVSVFLETLRCELEKRNHRIFIFAPSQSFTSSYSSEKQVWRLPSIKFYGDKQVRIALPVLAAREIAQLNLDIIHTHTPGPIGLLGLRLAHKLNIPVIHTYHTHFEKYLHYLHLPEWATKKVALLAMKNIVLNRHNAIIVSTQGIKTKLEEYGTTKPISVIPSGIDFEELKRLSLEEKPAAIIKKFGIKKNVSLLVSATRLGKEKNIEFLIRAVEYLKTKKNIAVRLIIAGDGPEKETLQRQVKLLGLEHEISFPGFLTHAELFTLYRISTAFVISSLTETLGLAVIEAMALGLPVVGVKATGVDEIMIRNQGGFMTRENVLEFSQAIEKLILDPDLYQKKKKEALKRAQDFSIENTSRQLLFFYRTAIQAELLLAYK